MSKINILDSFVYNRIAAGEVVERPRSIVKELVENSLDSGATVIIVSITGGGTDSIRVTDNGCGMDGEDLFRAFLPHATSKISAASDLDGITTLGFRGEALASIAAVSKVTMTSRRQCDQLGQTITMDGGTESDKGECGAPFGTSVLVEQLFDKIPARKKFLGTKRAEEAEISNLCARLILANHGVSIKYISDGKTVFHSGGKGIMDAICTVYGLETLDNLCEIRAETDDIKISGFVSRTGYFKYNRSFQTLVVNGRYVVDTDISNTVYGCFRDYLMVRQYPMYVMFVDLPPDMADVNIHPSKMQVRFAAPKRVLGMIRQAIDQGLYASGGVAAAVQDFEKSAAQPDYKDFGNTFAKNENPKQANDNDRQTGFDFANDGGLSANDGSVTDGDGRGAAGKSPAKSLKYGDGLRLDIFQSVQGSHGKHSGIMSEKPFSAVLSDFLSGGSATSLPKTEPRCFDSAGLDLLGSDLIGSDLSGLANTDLGLDSANLFSDRENGFGLDAVEGQFFGEIAPAQMQFKHLGKVFNTYILLEIGNDLYMIDQHAAHERLIFDQLYKAAQSKSIAVQTLLVPYRFELSHDDGLIFDEALPALSDCGIAVEKQQGFRYLLCAVPLPAAGMNVPKFLDTLLELIRDDKVSAAGLVRDRIISSACKAAVKGEDDLSDSEIQAVLHGMSASGAAQCPHGRPAVIKISRSQIEKWFKRR